MLVLSVLGPNITILAVEIHELMFTLSHPLVLMSMTSVSGLRVSVGEMHRITPTLPSTNGASCASQ